MALTKKPPVRWYRLHFLVRLLGLTGLTVALVGLALALLDGLLTLGIVLETWEILKTAVRGEAVERYPPVAIGLLLAGIVAGLFTLIVELLVVLRLAAGRHSAFGFNVLVQVALASFLVIGINVYSYQKNYLRFDWTRNRQFTLDAQLQEELRQLQGDTTIVVYLPHQSFGDKVEQLKSLDELGISTTTLADLVGKNLADAQARAVDPQRPIARVGIGQFRLKTRHKSYVTIMTDLTNAKRAEILAVAEGRDDAAARTCLEKLTPQQRQRVRTYRADQAFYKACHELLPAAEADPFQPSVAERKAYLAAAERRVIEKVEDVVEQLRRFSPRFQVVVLDTNDWRNYRRKLEAVTRDIPDLEEAIEEAPENTVFVVSEGKIQRLGFHQLAPLDLEGSRKANNGIGNLVLLDQGLAPLTRKILAVDEKRPRIGIAVIHELLTTQGRDDLPYTLAGLRRTLTARGYDVKDIVLKKWSRFGPTEHAVYTVADSKLDTLDEQLVVLNVFIARYEAAVKQAHEAIKYWKTASLEKLTREAAEDLGVKKVGAAERQEQIERWQERIAALQESIAGFKQRLAERTQEKASLNVDNLSEQRRLQDLQAKFSRTLADCDLLIVPRMTLRDVTDPDGNIPNSVHRLDDAQVAALRDFLKQGKPILACLGATNDPGDRPFSADAMGTDGVERMLEELGIRFVNQTILFDAESEAFAGNRAAPFGGVEVVEVPPVEFTWREGDRPPRLASALAGSPHPIRESLRLTARCLGRISERDPSAAPAPTSAGAAEGALVMDIRLRHPQPVYYEPPPGSKLAVDPYILVSNRAAWNEDRPFPSEKYVPGYEKLKKDPNQGTHKEKRHGQFPLGVAIETPLPAGWYPQKNVPPATVRLAVIGHGSVFNGSELSPARESLLLDTVNWLLGRDDELTRSDKVWTYPRVELGEKATRLWQWGAWVGLPGLFAYLGLVVLLIRRLR